MENFATKNQQDLIEELKSYKLKEETKLTYIVGIVRQLTKDNINGIQQAIDIIQESLDKLLKIT